MWRKVLAVGRPSPIGSKHLRLQPQALADVRFDESDGRWLLTGPQPRLVLLPEQGQHLSGWVLLRGKLYRRGTDFTALLFTEQAGAPGEWSEHAIPVSLKGTVMQLVHFKEGVTRLEFQPMADSGSFELGDFYLQKISYPDLLVRRAQRVRHVFATKPRSRREKIGLYWYSPFLSLRKSYELSDRLRGHYPTLSYSRWLEEVDALTLDDRRRITEQVRKWRVKPRFWVSILAGIADGERLKITLNSFQSQLYLNVQVRVIAPADEVAGLRAMTRAADWLTIEAEKSAGPSKRSEVVAAHDWLMTVPPGTVLARHALYWYASVALRDRECRLLYADHDFLAADGERVDPQFKPDWSPELLRSSNYIDVAVAVRGDLAAAVSPDTFTGGPLAMATAVAEVAEWGVHAYLLRATARLAPSQIEHIPAVLLHLPAADALAVDPARAVASVATHLIEVGIDAEVSLSAHGYCQVRYRLPASPPMVSIVVPTRDGVDHLRACVDSVLDASTYRNFEILVVDNQSVEAATLAYLAALQARPQVRVLPFARPFNYSAINNFAAANARGEVLCLLNNDTEVITPDWLEEMLGHLIQPTVGVVGAKLYFGDGRVQHAGDTVGPGGCAHHLHSFLPRDAPGYCGRAVQAQDLSAVTGACLLTWRALYQSLGGLDEANLPVAFNDVDYCLRVREVKRRVVWTPFAELYHHESLSRGKDDNPEKAARAAREVRFMRRRWQHLLQHDPFYNPNLSYERPDFSLSHSPVIAWPWRR
ncbi:MAG: glycosyltransferase [Candidatus Accumulibacter sp. UW20]|jgi:GT2 family glycosyltransferase